MGIQHVIIAYLILAHRYPDQLARLIDRLPVTSPILVHFDARADPRDWSEVQAIAALRANVQLVRRHRCYWGSFGIVAGTVELVASLVDSQRRFDYAVLLSGCDYPIKSNIEIETYLEARSGREHIECFPLDEPNRWDNDDGPLAGRSRYRNYYLSIRSRTFRIRANRRPPLGLRLHCGTQWWALSAACIRYCHAFLREHPAYLRFFRSTAIPDEAVFQTIIASSPFRQAISGREPTLAIWGRPEPPFPATLTLGDWDELVASPFLFARKMDPALSAQLMNRLDAVHADVTDRSAQRPRIAAMASATWPMSAMPSTLLTMPRAS
jgi:hypothetical protein